MNQRNLTPILASLWLSLTPLLNGAGPLPQTEPARAYTNPILAGNYPDPTVLRVGEDYYMTHSSFRYAPGFLIWRSRDLIHWSPVTHALPHYDGDVWAADLVHHQGLFYLYYRSTAGNRVITASQIEGPWSQPISLKVGEIDPGHVVGPDGKRYLYYSGGKVVGLADDGLSVTGELQKVYDGWPIPADWRVECACLEGPKLLFRDGWYHLFNAQGGTAGPSTSHMMIEARSRSPLGPWENSPFNPVLHTYHQTDKWWSRGHGTVFNDATGQSWVIYHAYDRDNLTMGRQTLMEPIQWTPEGWARVPEGIDPARPIPAPHLPSALPAPLERSDDFAGTALGWQWQFWGEYDSSRFQCADQGLVLNGKGLSPGDASPLACMAGDASYKVEVEVEVQGDAQAGLILFYDPSHYAGLGISDKTLWAGERGQMKKNGSPAAPRKTVFCLISDHNEVDFLAGPDRNSLKKVYCSINVSGYTHQTLGGYLDLRPALYCAGNGQAVFRHFKYTPIK